MKTTSRFALVAAAGFLVSGYSLSARAADLGGDCCADLEERVAELEATTVRKGNRKVSVELSGQVNRALLSFDDGIRSDSYIIDNGQNSSRFRIKGTGVAMPGLKAGFYIEIETRDSASQLIDQFNNNVQAIDSSAFRQRQSNVFIESESLGRVTLGLQNTAAKDVTLINLGGSLMDADNQFTNSFYVRDKGIGTLTAPGRPGTPLGTTGKALATWGDLANALDTTRLRGIRYDTPSIYGFIGSVFWGENDFFDAALRFQKEWNSIRIAAGVGYYFDGDPARVGSSGNPGLLPTGALTGNYGDIQAPVRGAALDGSGNSKIEVISGSASVMHVPTGIYANVAAGTRHISNPVPGLAPATDDDASYWYGQLGITKRFLDVGATTVYGEYGNYDKLGNGFSYNPAVNGLPVTGGGPALTRIIDSTAEKIGAGVVQSFDGAALQLYAQFQHYNADIKTQGFTAAGGFTPGTTASQKPEDIDVVVTGARIQF